METPEIYALVVREFEMYYQSDELVWSKLAFSELAKCSADRLSFYAKEKDIHALVSILQKVRSERAGSFVRDVERGTNIDWGEEENWELLKNQVDMILINLEGKKDER